MSNIKIKLSIFIIMLLFVMLLMGCVTNSTKNSNILTENTWFIQSANAPEGTLEGCFFSLGIATQLILTDIIDENKDIIGRQYHFIPTGDGRYNIIAFEDHFLDISGAFNGQQNRNGVAVQLWENNGFEAQKFKLIRYSEGLYMMQCIYGRYVQSETYTGEGTGVYTWENVLGKANEKQKWNNQLWRFINTANGEILP